jgi:3-oxoacyl-(acyl-carrier-protein) synthase
VKGLIGHTLGAAGLVEALLGALLLERGVVPGIAGLREPEAAGVELVRRAHRAELRHVMKTSSGFGGMNAAVVLSRGEEAA